MTRAVAALAAACLVAACLVAVAMPVWAAQADAARAARPAADVGPKRLTVADVEAALREEKARDLQAGRLDAFTSEARARALDELVNTTLLALAARDAGIDAQPDVRREIERLVDELLARRMTAEIAAKTDVSENALRAYYARHPERFQVPGRVRARHIVVRTEGEATSILGQLRRNADFAALARKHNIDSTQSTGGELGWVGRGVMVANFDRVLFSLKVGEISPVVQTSFGFHIAQVQEIEPPKPKPFESVAAEIVQLVRDAAVQATTDALKKKYPVKLHQAAAQPGVNP